MSREPHVPGPDPLVRAALVHLPVPEHDPAFWEALEARLEEVDADAAPSPALSHQLAPAPARRRRPLVAAPLESAGRPERPPAGEPVRARAAAAAVPPAGPEPVDVPRAVVAGRMRRRSNVVLAGVAAAAAVVVLVAGLVLVRQDDTTVGTVSDDTGQPTGTADGADGDGPADSVADGAVGPATEAVRAWVAALEAGDTGRAWDLLAPRTQDGYGTEDAFADLRTDLAEGYGAWAAVTPDLVVETTVATTGEETIELVTMVGDVAQEGPARRQVLVLPVRVRAEGAVIELPPRSALAISHVTPPATPASGPTTLGAGESVAVAFPEGCRSPVLRVDDGPVVTPGDGGGSTLEPREGGQQVATYDPGPLEAGEHVLTAGCVEPDSGWILASATRFATR